MKGNLIKIIRDFLKIFVEFCRTIMLDILWKILYIRNIIKQGQENDILFHIIFFNILFGQKNYFKNNCQENNKKK